MSVLNLKYILWGLFITIVHFLLFISYYSFYSFSSEVDRLNESIEIVELSASPVELTYKVYGIDLNRIQDSKLSDFYLRFNVKLVETDDVAFADLGIIPFYKVEKYLGVLDLFTFVTTDKNSIRDGIFFFNKNVKHTLYMDQIIVNLDTFKWKDYQSVGFIVKNLERKDLAVRLVQENIPFKSSDLSELSFFSKDSPFFKKNKEDFPVFRFFSLSVLSLILILLSIEFTVLMIKGKNCGSYKDKDIEGVSFFIVLLIIIIYAVSAL